MQFPHRGRLLALASATLAFGAGGIVTATAQSAVPPAPVGAAWGTGTLTDANLHSLVSRMTLAEEISMVHGTSDETCDTSAVGCVGQAGTVPGVARLGIPPLRLTDGPAGIRLGHVETALPAPVGLTASFDRNAAQLFGKTVGDAGRATDQDVWLGPMTNAVNFITGGRNFETLGEDPYLAGELLAHEVRGVQGEGFVATLKHWIENDFENNRGSASVKIDDQTFHETEYQAFEKGLKAGAGSVMCSYNRINDVYSCGNDHTLNDVLKGELAFQGFVMSDWGGTHRMTDLIHGLDLEMPRGRNLSDDDLAAAVADGTPAVPLTNDFPGEPAYSGAQWKAALDAAVLRILWTMNQAGLLEGTQYGSHHTDGTPYVPARPDLDALESQSFAAAQAIAEDSATLLENDGHALPLTGDDLSGDGTVVMGPTAIAPYVGGGGSAHVTPYDPVQSPLDALNAKAPSGSKISYVPGYDLDGVVAPASAFTAPDPAEGYPNWTLTPADAAFAGQHGLLRQQITTDDVDSGDQPALQPGGAPDRLDPTVDYAGASTLPADTGWRWSGTLTAPSNPAGTDWELHVFVAGQQSAELFVDGLSSSRRGGDRPISIREYPSPPSSSYAGLGESERSHDPAHPDLQQDSYSVSLDPGQKIHLDLRLVTGDGPAQIQLRWLPPDDQAASIAAAASAAAQANKAVIFAYDEGSEGRDRGGDDQQAGITLPGDQDALISAVAAAQPNTVVVLNTGDPVLMPWASQVKSILEMWYPGQLGGPATADVLLGNVDPGGHLPETFPAADTRFPTYDPNCDDSDTSGNCPLYPGAPQPGFVSGDHGYPQVDELDAALGNGIFQGYRWYDKHGVTPLFAFGHGLSYTTFGFSNLTVTPRFDGTVDVGFDVTNTGAVAGDEVPQVYVSSGPAVPDVQQAVKALHGFDRLSLDPGQTKHETITLDRRSFQYWSSDRHAWVTDYGPRTIWVGDAADDLPLSASTAPLASTGTTGGVSGTVPATLALTLGAPASFGAFAPGVTDTYAASTTANVISTAGDALLTVSDTDTQHPGHLANGSHFLPEPLQARAEKSDTHGTAFNDVGASLNLLTWRAPVSNDPVDIFFSQKINATDALRTGTYGKTLTFTLSTDRP